ncbi:MAG: hypothetical protein AYK18_15710 [Theionarchaea archaeon DG-70]|nr:MAG: hypothetical protein AYK18_15710 [Theionarchaea archaeon DG-70]
MFREYLRLWFWALEGDILVLRFQEAEKAVHPLKTTECVAKAEYERRHITFLESCNTHVR